jgi:hypothetical protein
MFIMIININRQSRVLIENVDWKRSTSQAVHLNKFIRGKIMIANQLIAYGIILLSSRLSDRHPLKAQLSGIGESVLMVQRGALAPRNPGDWTIPTGVVERDEWVMTALMRKAEDELGVFFVPGPQPIHRDSSGLYDVRYYIGDWTMSGSTPVLRPSPGGIMENIGFGFVPLEKAIALGAQKDLVFIKALRKAENRIVPYHLHSQPTPRRVIVH